MKLKPCPFCGSENCKAIGRCITESDWACCECGTIGPTRMTVKEAEDAWNHRNSDWIPVSTLPDIPEGKQESAEVLAIDKSGYMHLAYLRDTVLSGIQWVNSASGLFYTRPGEITHWMPLPEPPKEDE